MPVRIKAVLKDDLMAGGERHVGQIRPVFDRPIPVWGSGFWILGFKVQGSGFRIQGSGFRVQSSGFRVQSSGFRVQSSGFRVRSPRT